MNDTLATLNWLVEAGADEAIADQHDGGMRHAIGKDGVGGGALEAATVKGFQRGLKFRKAGGRRRGRHGAAYRVTRSRKRGRRAGGNRGPRLRCGQRLHGGFRHQPVHGRVGNRLVSAGFDQPVEYR